MIYWFIGQPGCGKTTLAKRLKKTLDSHRIPAIHLDGDDLRKIFEVPYDNRDSFSKEHRSTQTRALQRFVAHVADQGVSVIVSTVNPYRDIREEFKKSRSDVREIYVYTNDIRGREHLHVKNFEKPELGYILCRTGEGKSEDEIFGLLCQNLKRKRITATIVSNVSIGGVAAQETKVFDTEEELDAWAKENTAKYGGFPVVFQHTEETL